MDCQSRRRKSGSFPDEDEARKMSRVWIQDNSMLSQGVILSTPPPPVIDHTFIRLPQQQQQQQVAQGVNDAGVPLSLQAAIALQEIRSSIDSAKHNFLQHQRAVTPPQSLKFAPPQQQLHQVHQQQNQLQQQQQLHQQLHHQKQQLQHQQQHLQQQQAQQQQHQQQVSQQQQHHLQQQQQELKNLQQKKQQQQQQQRQQMPPKGNTLLDTRYMPQVQVELPEVVPKFPQASSHLMIPPVIFPPSLSGISAAVTPSSSGRLMASSIMQMPKLPNDQSLPSCSILNDFQQQQQQQVVVVQQSKCSPWFPSSASMDLQRPSTSSSTSTSGMNSMFPHELDHHRQQQQQEHQNGDHKLTRGLNPPQKVQYVSSSQMHTSTVPPPPDDFEHKNESGNEVDNQQKSTAQKQQDHQQQQQQQQHQDQRPPTRTFTKVYKLGSIGRAIDVSRFRNYVELRAELSRMFALEGQLELKNGWQLVFVDKENDLLLVGDDPWEEFVATVRGIRILSPSEVSYYINDERGEGVV